MKPVYFVFIKFKSYLLQIRKVAAVKYFRKNHIRPNELFQVHVSAVYIIAIVAKDSILIDGRISNNP